MPQESLTVLQPTNKRPLTKIISDNQKGGFKISTAGLSKNFRSWQVKVNSIHDLAKELTKIHDNISTAVVRGRLMDGADPDNHLRRMASNPEGGCYLDQELQALIIDIDAIPLALVDNIDPAKQPEKVINKLIDYLPPIFHNTTTFYQFSASSGFKEADSVSCHLAFWLDKKANDTQLKSYWGTFNELFKAEYGADFNFVDTVLYNPIQLIFTAKPKLLKGVDEVMKDRVGLIEKKTDTVAWSSDWMVDNKPSKHGDPPYFRFLDKIGDNKDGFHYPIMQAIGSFISTEGTPEAAGRQGIKEMIRSAVDKAKISETRSESDIERYKSDHFLNTLIDGAISKGFGSHVLTQGAKADIMKRWIFNAATDCFYDTLTDIEYVTNTFNRLHYQINEGKPLEKIVLTSPEFRKVHKAQPMPGRPEFVEENNTMIYNTWKGRPVLPTEGAVDCGILDDHLRYLTDHNDDAYEHLKCYLAYAVCRPGKKIRHALVLGSEFEGTGKSYLAQMLKFVMGRLNVVSITTEMIKSPYNQWAKLIEMVCVEELMVRGRLDVANVLKPYITESTIQIHEKFKPHYEINNIFNIMAFTNHRDAAMLGETDRRYWVWFSEMKPKDHVYYEKLFEWTERSAADIYKWFQEVDLSNFKPDKAPPRTTHTETMIKMSASPTELFIQEAIEESYHPFQCDLINILDVLDHINRSNKYQLSTVKFTNIIRKLGGINLGAKRFPSHRKRIWAIRDQEKWDVAMESEIVKSYREAGTNPTMNY